MPLGIECFSFLTPVIMYFPFPLWHVSCTFINRLHGICDHTRFLKTIFYPMNPVASFVYCCAQPSFFFNDHHFCKIVPYACLWDVASSMFFVSTNRALFVCAALEGGGRKGKHNSFAFLPYHKQNWDWTLAYCRLSSKRSSEISPDVKSVARTTRVTDRLVVPKKQKKKR